MSTPRLTDTAYAVLGLIERCGPATPYQLKQVAQVSIFHFWSIPHTQIYTECGRLAEAGLLDEQREETGRRRRVYRLSKAGADALDRWREDPETDIYELRDPGLLKLFCGAEPAALAETQLERHERRLAQYLEMHAHDEMPEGMRLALEGGIGHEREYVQFWSRLRDGDRDGARPQQ
jgi:PadR family transcriptional regulator AphA